MTTAFDLRSCHGSARFTLAGGGRPPGRPGAARPLADLRREVEELNGELARRIRAGAIDAAPGSAWEHLRKTAVEKLNVTNPAYLEKRAGSSSEGAAGRSGGPAR